MTPDPMLELRFGQPIGGRPPLHDSHDWRLLNSRQFVARTVPVVNGEFRGHLVSQPFVTFIDVIPLPDPSPMPRFRLFRWLP